MIIKIQHKKLIVFLFTICIASILQAQDSTSLTLSLKEAENYAIDHNRTLQNASINIKKAEEERWQSLASVMPKINATFDYLNYCGYEMKLSGFTIPMNPSGTFAAQVAAAVTGAQIVGTMINKIAVEMADITAKKTREDITASVDQLYISALAMHETIDLLNKSYKNLETLYEMTQNAVKVGVSEQTDADKISVQVSTLKSTINNSQRSLEMLYNSLRLQLGCDVNTQITLSDKFTDVMEIGISNNILDHQFILDNNYSYQLLKKNLTLSEKQITMAKMNYMPTLSAYYQYNAKTYFGRDAGMNMTPPNIVGFSVALPIWSSLSNLSKYKESKLSYLEMQNTLKDTQNALLIQEKQLRYNIATAYDNYNIQKKNIDVSQRVFNNISDKYKVGRASSLEVTNASSEIITAESNYINAILQLVNANIAFKQMLGGQW